MSGHVHRQFRRWLTDRPVVPGIVHGRRSSYTHYGCRCDLCTDAEARYSTQRKREARTREGAA